MGLRFIEERRDVLFSRYWKEGDPCSALLLGREEGSFVLVWEDNYSVIFPGLRCIAAFLRIQVLYRLSIVSLNFFVTGLSEVNGMEWNEMKWGPLSSP
jgi:hypothetical protein